MPSVAAPSVSSLRQDTVSRRGPVEGNKPDGDFEAMLDSALPPSAEPAPAPARSDDRAAPAQNVQPSAAPERPRDTAAATTAEPRQADETDPTAKPKDATTDDGEKADADAAVDPTLLLADPQATTAVDPNAAVPAIAPAAPAVSPVAVALAVTADPAIQAVPTETATSEIEAAAIGSTTSVPTSPTAATTTTSTAPAAQSTEATPADTTATQAQPGQTPTVQGEPMTVDDAATQPIPTVAPAETQDAATVATAETAPANNAAPTTTRTPAAPAAAPADTDAKVEAAPVPAAPAADTGKPETTRRAANAAQATDARGRGANRPIEAAPNTDKPAEPTAATTDTAPAKDAAPVTQAANSGEPKDAKADAKPHAHVAVDASDVTTQAAPTDARPNIHTAVQPTTGADPAQTSMPAQANTGVAQTNAAATPVNAPYAAASQAPVPISGLAVEIVAQARGGNNKFEIRLDPAELGRIDVHLHIDRDGNVTSRLVVERSETLDLLRRDAQQLERALQNAGLKTGDQGLEFSLRDQTGGRQQDNDAPRGNRVVIPDEVQPLAGATYGRRLGLGAGLDIRV